MKSNNYYTSLDYWLGSKEEEVKNLAKTILEKEKEFKTNYQEVKNTYVEKVTQIKTDIESIDVSSTANISESKQKLNKQKEKYEKILEEILNEETPRLQQEIYQIERSYLLSEGMFRGAINKMKKFVSHVSDLLKNFYEKVIKNFVTKLFELAKQGITKFLEALGLEVEGEVSMKTPSW